MARRLLGRVLSAVTLLAASQIALAGDNPPLMSIPGQFSVSPSGASTYAIPISVPPGTAGVVPRISLKYTSGGGDGIVGLGWSLGLGVSDQNRETSASKNDGTSGQVASFDSLGNPIAASGGSGKLGSSAGTIAFMAITRCPRTIAADGVHGGVNYDSNDRFCLNSARLVSISGTYGANGTEYRTEIADYSKIVSYGSTGNGPSYFKVWLKNGLVLEFGNTADSRIVAVGKSTARLWALNRVSDRKTNYFSVTYTNDTTNGQFYPSRVDYTGNAANSSAPYNSVQFFYTSRSDVSARYRAGSLEKTTVLLTNIKTYEGANLVTDYRLGYRSGTLTVRSRLTSLSQCDASGLCLAPTTFGWQGGDGLVTTTTVTPSFAHFRGGPAGFPGDFNGDGLSDINLTCMALPPFPSNCTALATQQVGTYTMTAISWSSYPTSLQYKIAAATGDFDGDGITDFWVAEPYDDHDRYVGTFFIPLRVNGYGVSTYLGGEYPYDANGVSTWLLPGDFDGDGKTDTFSSLPDDPVPDLPNTILGDFDGDGCTDNLFYAYMYAGASQYTSGVSYSCSPATPFAAGLLLGYGSSGENSYVGARYIVAGDFNGDGLTDVLRLHDGPKLDLSTGTGFAAAITSSGLSPYLSVLYQGSWGSSSSYYRLVTGDWNGDGKTDVALINMCPMPSNIDANNHPCTATNAPHRIFLSTGTDFVEVATIPINGSVWPAVGDWNSDGADDLWFYQSSSDSFKLFSYVPELMNSVSNGIGATTTVTYDRLNKNGSFYQKCANGTYVCNDTYPVKAVDGPVYVVKQVDRSNGIGGNFTSTYAYQGYKTHLTRSESLGFSQITETNVQTGVVTTTNYRQDFPYAGLVSSQTQVSAGVTIASVVNTYADSNPGTGTDGVVRHDVQLTRSVASGHDLDGSTLPTTTTTYSSFVCFGYPGQITSSVSDGSSRTVTDTYTSDNTYWLCQKTASSVQSVVGSSNVTRHVNLSYVAGTYLVSQQVVEPGDSAHQVTTGLTYDVFGNPTQTTVSGNGISISSTTASYDSQGRFRTGACNALIQCETYAFDARFGTLTNKIDFNNLPTSWTYDNFGRPTREVRPDGNRTSTAYSYCSGVNGGTASCPTYGAYAVTATPQSSSGTQSGAQVVGYVDGLERSIATDVQGFGGSWTRTATQYNNNGWVAQLSRPYFVSGGTPRWTVNNTYDVLGRAAQVTQSNGRVDVYRYCGLVTSVTVDYGSKNQTSATVKNAQGLTATVEQGTGINTACHPTTVITTASYTYDAFNNLKTITDAAGNITTNTYDVRGNRTASSDPDMGSWSYSYDVLGQLTSQTDAKSQTSSLSYDVLGRLVGATEGSFTRTFTYDTAAHGIGLLASTSSSDGTSRTFAYDSLSRPASATLTVNGITYPSTTSYNTDGRIYTLAYPSGFTAKYSYNTFGYLCRITQASDADVSCNSTSLTLWRIPPFGRDAEQHITQQAFGNSAFTQTNTYYDDTGLLNTTRAGVNDAVAAFDYIFDRIGSLTYRSNNLVGTFEQFCYDNLNRLTEYAAGNAVTACTSSQNHKTLTYNAIGNIITKSDVGTYAYPAAGQARPHAVGSVTGTVNGVVNPSFTYDANGNMTAGAGRAVTYTAFNMVASIAQGTTSFAYAYDATHNRVKQTEVKNGTTTTTVYVDDLASGFSAEKIATSSQSYNWNDYIVIPSGAAFDGKAGGIRIGMHVTTVTNGSVSSTANRYFVLDHLGSTAAIIKDDGTVLERLAFDPWGKRRYVNGTDDTSGSIRSQTNRGFTSHEHIDDVGLINMNARVYDPQLGRFMAADPVTATPYDSQSLNRYTYVNNRPLSAVDPTGQHIVLLFSSFAGGTLRHVGNLVGDNEHGWRLISKSGTSTVLVGKPDIIDNKHFGSLIEAFKFIITQRPQYDAAYFHFTKSREVDRKIILEELRRLSAWYFFVGGTDPDGNCAQAVTGGLDAGGIWYRGSVLPMSTDGLDRIINQVVTNELEESIKSEAGKENGWVDISELLKKEILNEQAKVFIRTNVRSNSNEDAHGDPQSGDLTRSIAHRHQKGFDE